MEIELIGISQNITQIRKLTDQVADTDLNIVVCGETGVGKEVVVRSLYHKSKRCGKAMQTTKALATTIIVITELMRISNIINFK